jgi:broad specificity phosphatase PhoE
MCHRSNPALSPLIALGYPVSFSELLIDVRSRPPMPAKRETIVLCLFRCGETDWDVQQRLVGAADLPLSEAGRAVVRDSTQRLRLDRLSTIYHPADEAATETSSILSTALNAKTRSVGDLADPDLGLLQGLTLQDFSERYAKRYKQWQEDILSLSPPEGEEMLEARSRLFSAITQVLKRSRGVEVGLVLHQLGVGLLRCWLADRPSSDIWPMIEQRPYVERYVFGVDMIPWLEAAAEAEYSRS